MDQKTRKKIIEEYLSGKGSTTIEKELKISKPRILKILKEENITRYRDRCKSIEILEKGGYYVVNRVCPKCNNIIETRSKDKVIACRNHFNKINGSSLCKKCSSELQTGINNPFYGKKHSNESKIKISKSRKGKATGENNPMANQKWRRKAATNLKKRWDSGELETVRKKMSEQLKDTRRKGKIKSVNVSKKEKELNEKIKKLGYDVFCSYRIDTKICDIFIPSLNLIIEYFGDYWHCNPKKYNENYFNKKKSQFAWEVWEYDKTKLDLIRNKGYNLEVIWESDLKNNNKIINHILQKYVTNQFTTPEWSRQN